MGKPTASWPREILDKLFHWNCEWLTRPNYAISELADTLYANLATLADYKDKVFTKHAVDPLLNKARPIRAVLQKRFGNFRRARWMRSPWFNEIYWRQHAEGTLLSIATHIMMLETLFSHPAEYAKRHRESPEVQSFEQNPSRESMVAYIASQTLSHTEIVPEEEEGGSIWDTLTQRSSGRQVRPTATFWDAIQENVEDDEPEYPYDEDDKEDIPAPTRRRSRRNVLEDENDEEDDDHEPFNTRILGRTCTVYHAAGPWTISRAWYSLPQRERQNTSAAKKAFLKN